MAARERGMTVYGEACPHNLLFEQSDQEGPDALRYVMTPPLRTRDDRATLLEGLAGGALDTYASDHCHLRLDRDKTPVMDDFTKIPTGLLRIDARCLWDSRSAATSAWGREAGGGGVRGARAGLRPLPEEGRCGAWKRCRHPRLGSVHAEHAHAREHQRCPRLVARRRPGHSGNPAPCARPRRRVVEDGRWLDADHRGEYLPVRRVAAPV